MAAMRAEMQPQSQKSAAALQAEPPQPAAAATAVPETPPSGKKVHVRGAGLSERGPNLNATPA